MKFISVLATLIALVAASPTPTKDLHAAKAHIAKRATVSDPATLGYATENGG